MSSMDYINNFKHIEIGRNRKKGRKTELELFKEIDENRNRNIYKIKDILL